MIIIDGAAIEAIPFSRESSVVGLKSVKKFAREISVSISPRIFFHKALFSSFMYHAFCDVDNFLSRGESGYNYISFLQLSIKMFFCYTTIHGKIYYSEKSKKSQKTWFFGQDEISWWTKGCQEKKIKGKKKAFHLNHVNV
jgi:hypothetical protein